MFAVAVPSAAQTRAPIVQANPPVAEMAGLHLEQDPAGLRSAAAFVIDNRTNRVLIEKNANALLPIASLTKLMAGIVVLDGRQSLDEKLEVTADDIDREKNSRSRLPVGSILSRRELLQLSLMSSENRASSVLARNYPGGKPGFVRAMNDKARAMQMNATEFADSSGLSPNNTSTVRDLLRLTQAAERYPMIREFSVGESLEVHNGKRAINFGNSNRLINSQAWNLRLQKTGYTAEAGSCIVLVGQVQSQPITIILLGAPGQATKFGDAHRIRQWLSGEPVTESKVARPKKKAVANKTAKQKTKVKKKQT